jgi:hypothetical protein
MPLELCNQASGALALAPRSTVDLLLPTPGSPKHKLLSRVPFERMIAHHRLLFAITYGVVTVLLYY